MKNKNFFEKILFPDYDEATFLNVSITLICLAIFNQELRTSLVDIFIRFDKKGLYDLILCIPYLLIVIDSIYHAFVKKEKNRLEIVGMLYLAVIVNLFNTAIIFNYLMESERYIFIIFPAINLIHIFVFLIIMKYGDDNDENKMIGLLLSEKELDVYESIMGIIVNLILFFISDIVLANNWAVTLTICITYTITIRKTVNSLLYDLYKLVTGKFKYPDIIN